MAHTLQLIVKYNNTKKISNWFFINSQKMGNGNFRFSEKISMHIKMCIRTQGRRNDY